MNTLVSLIIKGMDILFFFNFLSKNQIFFNPISLINTLQLSLTFFIYIYIQWDKNYLNFIKQNYNSWIFIEHEFNKSNCYKNSYIK